MIHLRCEYCGQDLKVPGTSAGKTGRCPKCKRTIVVPAPLTRGSTGGQESSGEPGVRPVDPACDTALLDIAPKGGIPDEAANRCHASGELADDLRELSERYAMEEAEPAGPPKLPWPIDAIVYPLNLIGIIHLVALWLLLFFLCPLVMDLGLGTEYIPFVYTLPVAYAVYYFAECIRDSAAGGRHVPDFWIHPADSGKWDCLSRLFDVLGCVAMCFWPVSVYYVVQERTDLIYWLLLACGGFFFPIVLLAVVLFDSFSALNLILIVGSILRTLVSYCGMVLLFVCGALLFVKIDFRLYGFRRLPTVPFLLRLVQLYMIFVAIALLGGFYQRHKDRLDWEV